MPVLTEPFISKPPIAPPYQARAQLPLDVVNRVEEPGVAFDHAPPQEAHRTGFANARLVVAVDVGAHRQLYLVLVRVIERANIVGILHRIVAASYGARDRRGLDAPAVDPDEHFGRSPDQLLVTHLDEEFVGARVDRLNLAKQVRRFAAVRC
jgi:hypothetical protein